MAIDMTQVKAITIPQGSVDKITDSNGNILWTSKDLQDYPYERLEYIQTGNTKQAIDTGVLAARNSYMKLYVEDLGATDAPQGRGAVANAQRFAAGYKGGGFFFGIGNSWIGPTGTATSGPHWVGVQGPECNILTRKVWGSSYNQGYYIDNTFTNNSNTFPSGVTWYSLYLLGSRENPDGDIQQPIPCKMYYAEYGYTNSNTHGLGYNGRYYPVRRRIDGVLGFYDLKNHNFKTLTANSIGTLTAGPKIANWDGQTDPSIKQTYTNSTGFVIPKGTAQSYESIDLMTLDNDIDYITFSAHLYHQAVGANGTKSANITVSSFYSAANYDAINNSSTSATTENPSNIRIELQGSGVIVQVFARGYVSSQTIYTAYEEIYYNKTTRKLTLRRSGDSNANTRIEITNIQIEAHTAY